MSAILPAILVNILGSNACNYIRGKTRTIRQLIGLQIHLSINFTSKRIREVSLNFNEHLCFEMAAILEIAFENMSVSFKYQK